MFASRAVSNPASGVDIGDNIANSLMLDSGSSQYLSKSMVAGVGSRDTSDFIKTYRIPCKRVKLGVEQVLISNYASSIYFWQIGFNSSDQLYLLAYDSTVQCSIYTTRVFRDPIAHLDICVGVDSTQATAGSRISIEVNGEVVSYTTVTQLPQNSYAATLFRPIGGTYTLNIGRKADGTYPSDIYLDGACIIVDGQKLPGSTFSRVSADTGQWVNKNYTGTYGNNGFKLDFSNGAALGTDSSGNGNNWTLNGGITSANQYTDTPTNNFCVWSSIASDASTMTVGNTKATTSASNVRAVKASLPIPRTGKWGCKITPANHVNNWIGVTNVMVAAADINTAGSNSVMYYATNGNKWVNGTTSAYGASYTTEAIEMVVDSDAQTITFYKAGVSQGSIALPSSTIDYCFFVANAAGASLAMQAEFGANSNAAYVPQASAKTLCTANMPEGTAAAPATFNGNVSADGTYVAMNGTPETATINGNAVTWGTHADRTAGGMKLRTSSASYNASGSNTLSCTFLTPNRKSVQKYQTAKGN